MPLLQLLVATIAVVAGSACCAAWIERDSIARRLLVLGILVPAQITAIVLAVGWLFGAFRPIPLLTATLVVSGAEAAAWRRSGRRPHPSLPQSMRTAGHELRRQPAAAVAVAFAVVCTGFQGIRALRVPVTSWDSLNYHLTEPSSWVLMGRVGRSGLTLFGSGYPQGQEVLHGWSIVFLHSIRGTGLIPLWLSLVGAVAVFRIGRHLGATCGAAAIGGAVFACMPAAALQIGTAYVDLGAASFGLAALSLALDARRAEAPVRLLLPATAAAALAVAAKPNLAPALVAVAVVGVGVSRRRRAERSTRAALIAPWTAGLLVALVLGGGWYLANYAAHRNPFYPVSTLGFTGEGSFDELVRSAQAPAELAGRTLPAQVWRSWSEDLSGHTSSYDQRLGGLGVVWLLACVPALAALAVRLGRRDRSALALVALVGAVPWAVSGSLWWGRYTLPLAGIGCAALGLAIDDIGVLAANRATGRARRRRVHRAATGVVGLVVLVLTAFSTVSAVNPTSELVDGVQPEPVGLGELASMMASGDGEQVLRPWAGSAGLDAATDRATIAFVGRNTISLPQIFLGLDLERRLALLDPPASPAALVEAMREAGAQYLYLPTWTPADALEAVAVRDRLVFRRVETDDPIASGVLWELGDFDECRGGSITATVVVTPTRGRVAGRAADGCGALADASIEIWQAGPSARQPWVGGHPIAADITTNGDGMFLHEVPIDDLDVGSRFYVRFAGREERLRYRPPLASDLDEVARAEPARSEG